MDEDKELQNSQESAEGDTQEQEQSEVESTEQKVEDTKTPEKKDDSALYNLVKRAEKAVKQLEKAQKQPTRKTEGGVSEEYIEEMMTLRDAGFTTEEIKKIRVVANAQGTSLADASKDPFVLGGIQKLRDEAKARAATPPPSKRSATKANKTFEGMTPQERAQTYSFQNWREERKKGK